MNKGTYVVFMQLEKSTKITIGQDKILFPKGYYAYVHAVSSGLDQLVTKHSKRITDKRTHIDAFIAKAKIKDMLVYKTPANIIKIITARLEKNRGIPLTKKLQKNEPPLLARLYFFPTLQSMIAFVK
ncbi:MAG: hypothetical protein V1725_07025 [archaeon]